MRISVPVAWPRRPRVVVLLGLVLTGSATGVLTGGTALGRNVQAPTRIVISLARNASTESSTKSAAAALCGYNPRDTIYTVMRAHRFAQNIMPDSNDANAPLQPAQAGPVLRLTFEYDGDQIRLVSQQHVRMIIPPSQPLEPTGEIGGFQVLLRDEQERPFYRLTRTSPLKHDTEVFSEPGAERSIERTPASRPQGSFVVLVPELPGGKTLEFLGQPLRPHALSAQSQSLGRFELNPPDRR
jgi:hypothetical protein